ncbi:MAG: hypothetical protein ACTSWY_11650 [Promethearchaeota archaeon]
MTNITFSVDDEMHKKMRQHPEIKWTEILRQVIRDYLKKLDTPNSISARELADQLGKSYLISPDESSMEEDLEYYQKMKKMEIERLNKRLKQEHQLIE